MLNGDPFRILIYPVSGLAHCSKVEMQSAQLEHEAAAACLTTLNSKPHRRPGCQHLNPKEVLENYCSKIHSDFASLPTVFQV